MAKDVRLAGSRTLKTGTRKLLAKAKNTNNSTTFARGNTVARTNLARMLRQDRMSRGPASLKPSTRTLINRARNTNVLYPKGDAAAMAARKKVAGFLRAGRAGARAGVGRAGGGGKG